MLGSADCLVDGSRAAVLGSEAAPQCLGMGRENPARNGEKQDLKEVYYTKIRCPEPRGGEGGGTARGIEKSAVEPPGLEPGTSCMPCKRSTN